VVVLYKDGNRIKQKTTWYISLHHKTQGKKFNGMHWDNVTKAIHGGFYDDVSGLIPKKYRARAERYMESLAGFDDYVASLIAPYKLEKHDDKEKVLSDLKNGFFEKSVPQKWLRSIVIDVLFGKHPDLYVNATKSKQLRDFIDEK